MGSDMGDARDYKEMWDGWELGIITDYFDVFC